MPLFLLIRHGENDFVKKGKLAGRLPDVHLNKKGREQVKATAAALARQFSQVKDNPNPIKVIYSSPLERARETAEPIAQALGAEIELRPGLMETDIGEWTGVSLKRLHRKKEWRTVQQAPSLHQFPGGESFCDTQHRMVQELLALKDMHDPKDVILCVSHADPIKLAVAYFIGLPIDQFQRLGVSPASITALFIGDGGSFLQNLNFDPTFLSVGT